MVARLKTLSWLAAWTFATGLVLAQSTNGEMEDQRLNALKSKLTDRWYWVSVSKTTGDAEAYISISVDSRRYDRINVGYRTWIRLDYDPPLQTKFGWIDEVVQRADLNCGEVKSLRAWKEISYFKGEQVGQTFAPSKPKWDDVIPGTVGEDMAEAVCAEFSRLDAEARKTQKKRRQ